MAERTRRLRPVGAVVAAVLVVAACGSSGAPRSVTPTVQLPNANGISGVVAYLSDQGVRCERVDVENEGPTASPVGAYARAMCYRPGARTLELLLYHSAAERVAKRPEMMSMPCGTGAAMRTVDGHAMTFAEGDNFDVRAASSGPLTPTLIDELNAATQTVAITAKLRLGHANLACAPR